MTQASRESALRARGLVHPHPETVTAEMFNRGNHFFFALTRFR